MYLLHCSKFTALKYKPNSVSTYLKWTPQVLSTVCRSLFYIICLFFLSIITLLLLTVTLSGISDSLDNTGIVSVFSKLLVDYSFDSVIFHQLSLISWSKRINRYNVFCLYSNCYTFSLTLILISILYSF